MALYEVFHVVASQYPIDPDTGSDIPQGSLVALGSDGNVTLATESTTRPAIGIAGDSRSQGTTSYTPESTELVTGAYGSSVRRTQNRVADFYNEVHASNKMTVYHSGGEFWTDCYTLDDNSSGHVCTFDPGTYVYVSKDYDGKFSDYNAGSYIKVGITVTSPTSFPNGVPGTTTPFTHLPEGGNSMSFGSYIRVRMVI